jgi:hypothetical protein
VLRTIFGLVKEEIAGGWKKLCSKGDSHLNCSPNTARVSGGLIKIGLVRDRYRLDL